MMKQATGDLFSFPASVVLKTRAEALTASNISNTILSLEC